MDLYEHQAKDLLARHGLAVPDGGLAVEPEQAGQVADRLLAQGAPFTVVKAQVRSGGRGRAGGVLVAHSAQEATEHARTLLGTSLCGHPVRAVRVEAGVQAVAEFYAAILLDRTRRGYTALCSAAGGVDVEDLARIDPTLMATTRIDPVRGLTHLAARELVTQALPAGAPEAAGRLADLLCALWEAVCQEDATLVEVNPVALTAQGELLALDAKVTIDDNALPRQPHLAALRDTRDEDPLEARARQAGLRYVRLDGQVGVLGNGAGLVMSTLDLVAEAGRRHAGVRPANFLDLGGSGAQATATGLEAVTSDPRVRAVLVNVFGGIASCLTVAQGVLEATAQDGVPVVVRLDGADATQARQLLRDHATARVRLAGTMEEAAETVAALAAGEEPA